MADPVDLEADDDEEREPKKPRHMRAPTYGRTQVPASLVQRLAKEQGEKSREEAPPSPPPLSQVHRKKPSPLEGKTLPIFLAVFALGVIALVATMWILDRGT